MRLIVLLLSCYCSSPKKSRVPSSPVNKAHGMDAVQGQHNLSRVKASPFLWHIVITHKVDQVTTRHVFHHHVEVAVVLECEKQLQDQNTREGKNARIKQIFGVSNTESSSIIPVPPRSCLRRPWCLSPPRRKQSLTSWSFQTCLAASLHILCWWLCV